MASSLEVVRHRVASAGMASPGHYHLTSSSGRRLAPAGIVGFSHHSQLNPVGFFGRHSWHSVSAQGTNSSLSTRVQKFNLRLSPPTPGEEELCRNWLQNSAKHSKRYNEDNAAALAEKHSLKALERPKTAQPRRRHYHDPVGRRPNKTVQSARMTSSGMDRVTSSESERRASPSATHRTSPPITTQPMNKISEEKKFTDTPRNFPNNYRAPVRPSSARLNDAKRRSVARNSATPPHTGAGFPRGKPDTQRWSLSDATTNGAAKDDDSAYSSSRDVTDRAQTNSPGPPRSAPNPRCPNPRSKFVVSGQDGRPVLYYRHNDGDSRLSHHNINDRRFIPPIRPDGELRRPVTQPAMGTKQRTRESGPVRRRSARWRSSEDDTSQWTSIVTPQRTLKSISQFLDPQLLDRILKWLEKIEPNPKLYYGFETDLFGGSIGNSAST